MSTEDILFDSETAYVKKGEVYLFSDSYLALKHYDKNLSNVENNKINKKYGYVYKAEFRSKTKRGQWTFCGVALTTGEFINTTFVCRLN